MSFLKNMDTCNAHRSGFFWAKAVFWTILMLYIGEAIGQPVTGVWRGRIVRGSGLRQSSATLEVKLIATGDSILGSAYYYGPGRNYIRYSLKGYFDLMDGSVVWQDYHMIDAEPKNAKGVRSFNELMKFRVDYSCPDGKTLRLDGTCTLPDVPLMQVELRKMENTFFGDEWDEVIAGYYTGMNQKEIIDSVWWTYSEPMTSGKTSDLAKSENAAKPPPKVEPAQPNTAKVTLPEITLKDPDLPEISPDTLSAKTEKPPVIVQAAPPLKPATPAAPRDITADIAKQRALEKEAVPPKVEPAKPAPTPAPVPKPVMPVASVAETPAAAPPVVSNPVMAGAFAARKKVVQTEIPMEGDTLELRFYDNAEVDGDSISLFLNGIALFQHVRLEARPYIFKISLKDLPAVSELTMVAENLGAIPPNTAYMEAIVSGNRYSARLESTEVTSGVVRLVRREWKITNKE
jgi:hypothetical protein